jgi:hypothetical protein
LCGEASDSKYSSGGKKHILFLLAATTLIVLQPVSARPFWDFYQHAPSLCVADFVSLPLSSKHPMSLYLPPPATKDQLPGLFLE